MDPKSLSAGDTAYRQDREVEVVREFDGMNTVVVDAETDDKTITSPASLTPAEDYEPPEPETDEPPESEDDEGAPSVEGVSGDGSPAAGETPGESETQVPDDAGSAGGEELPEFEDEIDPEEVADELENPDQEMAPEAGEEDDVVSCEVCGEEFLEEEHDNPEKAKAGHMNKH